MKYSTNELELLAIVWAVEHFRNYIYGTKFEVFSDHKALETALKSNHGNKTYSSRLTRWIDRILHFDMEVIHQPGRTLGLAEYLSRHPNGYNEKEWSKNAKEPWESWFVVNSVEEINKDYYRQLYTNHRLNKLFNQPIGIEQSARERTERENAASTNRISKHSKMSRLQASREKIAVRNLIKTSKSVPNKQIVQSQNLKTSPIQSIVSSIEENNPCTSTDHFPEVKLLKVKTFKEINDITLMANYQSDSGLQNVREAVLRRDVNFRRKENKLFKPVFKYLRVDRELVFFENRLVVIPRDMRQAVLNSIHSGHPGRDAMLGSVDEVWWPQIHRQIVASAKTCKICQNTGRNIKVIERQSEFGTIQKAKQVNEEVALDFMGPFAGAPENKKYLLVGIDQFSAYPTLKFVKNTAIKEVTEFLRKYISDNEIPQIIRTDQATVFMRSEFRQFRNELGMRHVVCPIYDHRGNGKVERLVRTIIERLRANPEVLTEKQNKLFYELIGALRTNKGKDGKSSFERHTGRKPNTVTSIIVNLYKELNDLEFDRTVDLEKLVEFPRDDDSTIFVRNRQRKGKLAGLFKKRRGKITGETSHTFKFVPAERTNEIVLSKREVARGEKKTRKQQKPKKAKNYVMEEIEKEKKQQSAQVFADLEENERNCNQDTANDTPTVEEWARRSRKAPDRYGLPVYICGVSKPK